MEKKNSKKWRFNRADTKYSLEFWSEDEGEKKAQRDQKTDIAQGL